MNDASLAGAPRPRIGPPAILALAAILAAAAALRGWGIAPDLPYIWHPDEPVYLEIIANIFKTGDLNPHWFDYPSLLFYLNALAYVPYYWIGKLAGVFHSTADILPPLRLTVGTAFAPTPSAALVSRCVTAVFGCGSVLLGFVVGRRLTGRVAVGLLVATLIALSPTHVGHSRYIWPGTFVVFWSLVALLGAVRVYREGRMSDYLLAGIGVGLTASSKYNGAIVGVAALAAVVLRGGWQGLKDPRVRMAAAAAAIAFFATTPFAIFDPITFLKDMRSEGRHYALGHPGMEGNSLVWYVSFLAREEGVPTLLALVAMIRGGLRRSKETLLLGAFPVIYFVFISAFTVRNDRTILPILAFLYVLAAALLVEMGEAAMRMRAAGRRVGAAAAVGLLTIFAIALPPRLTCAETLDRIKIDSRTTARAWIRDHLPPGSHVAIESYSPWVDPGRYVVVGLPKAIDHEPDWYPAHGVDYLICAQGMYGRFYNDRARYASEVQRYDAIFARWPLLARFTDGGYEVRIYQVKSSANPTPN